MLIGGDQPLVEVSPGVFRFDDDAGVDRVTFDTASLTAARSMRTLQELISIARLLHTRFFGLTWSLVFEILSLEIDSRDQ